MALFYSLAGFGHTPTESIWIAYLSNIISFSLILYLILHIVIKGKIEYKNLKIQIIALIIVISLSIFSLNPTTESLYRIHADYPALFFLLIGIYFNTIFLKNNKFTYLFLCSVSFILSAWAKLPTITCIFVPSILFISSKHRKNFYYYNLFLIISVISTLLISSSIYSFNDMKFILHDHITSAGWSDRHHLFNGKNADIVHMDYFQATPLLFRFFIMYLHEFWLLFTACLFSLFFSFTNQCIITSRVILKTLSLTYFLLLPPCLSALAHFGGVENSLFFVNILGYLVCVVLFCIVLEKLNNILVSYSCLSVLALILLLPNIRQSRSFPTDTLESPHQQAFNYLIKGNTDIYFGWYPIAHLQANFDNYSCIEVPIWAGMTKPTEIDFSKNHFPKKAKYLATSQTGYGKSVLKQYLGNLEEVDGHPELSQWRLWQIVDAVDH